jgi:hypothetical protein
MHMASRQAERVASRQAAKDLAPGWVRAAARVGTRSVGLASAPLRGLPDFLIIGTKRGGTTSLWNYLIGHPDILAMFPSTRGLKSPAYFFENYDRGEDWYRSHFHTRAYKSWLQRRRSRAVVTGEASPYYMYYPHGADRVHALVPDVKLIVLLRDPVRRAYSHYWERVGQGVETLSFDDALAAEAERTHGEWDRMLADPSYYSQAHDFFSYRDRGLYQRQLERWFATFPARQLLILPSEQFYGDTQGAYDLSCDFLGVARRRVPTAARWNEQRVPAMSEAARSTLREFYRPRNAELFSWLGRDFGWND